MDQSPTQSKLPPRRIGFVSTRFAGTDGVSLESRKWALVLERLGHACYYFAGESDRPTERSRIVPIAHFLHSDIREISDAAFSRRTRSRALTQQINALVARLKSELYTFAREFELELLVTENALTLPLNIPLGLAITEFIAETGLPVIAHHHDFVWERRRFLVSGMWDYLAMAFPPHLPSIRHVVINSLAAEQLGIRRHIFSMLIPNVMDFENPPAPPDAYASDLRAALGVATDERLVLQPTRVVPRKGIEHAIELVSRLGLNARLIISHASGDEGDEYEQHVRVYAQLHGVRTNFVNDIIAPERGRTADGRKVYSLGDAYSQADLVTYPSNLEGFGNAFLEAIYYQRPIVVNNYSVYNVDIKPKDFTVIEFDGYVTARTVEEARHVLENPRLAAERASHNYDIARRYYSLAMLKRRLETLLTDCFGE
jgi:glycosyltransferase involved in cell wall biosynthesis